MFQTYTRHKSHTQVKTICILYILIFTIRSFETQKAPKDINGEIKQKVRNSNKCWQKIQVDLHQSHLLALWFQFQMKNQEFEKMIVKNF